jgi:hypothetical protein
MGRRTTVHTRALRGEASSHRRRSSPPVWSFGSLLFRPDNSARRQTGSKPTSVRFFLVSRFVFLRASLCSTSSWLMPPSLTESDLAALPSHAVLGRPAPPLTHLLPINDLRGSDSKPTRSTGSSASPRLPRAEDAYVLNFCGCLVASSKTWRQGQSLGSLP